MLNYYLYKLLKVNTTNNTKLLCLILTQIPGFLHYSIWQYVSFRGQHNCNPRWISASNLVGNKGRGEKALALEIM